MTGLEHDHPVAGRERVRQRRLPGPSSRRRIDHDRILGLEDSFHPGDDLLPEGPEFGAAMVNRRHRDRPQHPVGDIGRPGNLQKMAAGMHGGGVLHRDGAPWNEGLRRTPNLYCSLPHSRDAIRLALARPWWHYDAQHGEGLETVAAELEMGAGRYRDRHAGAELDRLLVLPEFAPYAPVA